MATALGRAEIEVARERLAGVARVTPVYGSETLSRLAGRPVHLKAENLQRTGSFKIRGAGNCIAMLSDSERAAGVVAASAGNHAQAVAWAAREAGIEARIFMPEDTPVAKVEATQNYGARIELGGEMFDEAHEAAQAFAESSGATFVHPFEDERVIIEGVPTLILSADSALAEEAVESAETLDYEGVGVRVVRPEHLVALYLEPPARSEKRRARADALLAWPGLNRKRLGAILARHGLEL